MRLADLAVGTTLVCGFGREGRSLERVVLDCMPDADVAVHCDRAPELAPCRWPLSVGPLTTERPRPARVLRSPGFPVDHPALVQWRAAGTEVTCISSLWFGERPDARVLAVTGSKGKSTTASLLAHLLRGSGVDAVLAGNIGVPVLDLLATEADWFVLELSSYQLADLQGHAECGVITRLFPEHQDWHGGVEPYYAAKLRLLEMVGAGGLWINGRDPVLVERVSGASKLRIANCDDGLHARADGLWRGGELLLPAAAAPLPGRHNLDNLALALSVVEAVTGDIEPGLAALASFRGLPHRLEPVAGPGGAVWINDSIATTPYATLAALQADPRPTVLICGGQERGGDWSEVIAYLAQAPLRGAIGLPDNGPRILAELVAAGAVPTDRHRVVEQVEQAVMLAAAWVEPGGRVLLSPGAPSFPQFRDFEQRGERFRAAVAALTSS